MRILFVADVMGKAGRRLVGDLLPGLVGREEVDLTVVNAENAAGGRGVTPDLAAELFELGADVLTGGNHTWDPREAEELLEDEPRVLRPHNYPDAPGSGLWTGETAGGVPCAVLNLQGRVFMQPLDCPFRTADEVLEEVTGAKVFLVDFHAEATSEKAGLGWHLDGRVTGVLGTHTHVPTADARILAGGTAYCTDVGMTGPWDSIIGMEKEGALRRLVTQRPRRLRPAKGDPRLCCITIDCDEATGRAQSVRHRVLGPDGDELLAYQCELP